MPALRECLHVAGQEVDSTVPELPGATKSVRSARIEGIPMTKEERAAYMRNYRKGTKWKKWEKKYQRKRRANISEDQKRRRRVSLRKWHERKKDHVRAYRKKPAVMRRQKLYRSKPAVKQATKLYHQRYHKEWYHRPKVKQQRNRPEAKLAKKLYDQQYHKGYYQRPEVKLKRKLYYAKRRQRAKEK
jgi:hypothetical protein